MGMVVDEVCTPRRSCGWEWWWTKYVLPVVPLGDNGEGLWTNAVLLVVHVEWNEGGLVTNSVLSAVPLEENGEGRTLYSPLFL